MLLTCAAFHAVILFTARMNERAKELEYAKVPVLYSTAPLSDLLVNLWLNKSKRVFSSGGARTHTTRELNFSSQMLYQLSYRGF